MKQHRPNVESIPRWRDRPSGGAADEDRAAALVRDALGPAALGGEHDAALDDERLAAIEEGLQSGRRGRPPAWLRPAVVAALLTVSVASVMGYERGWFAPLGERLGFRRIPPVAPAQVERPRKHAVRAALDRTEAAAAAPPVAPPVAAEPVAPRVSIAKHADVAPIAKPAFAGREPGSTPGSEEIQTLQQAMSLLRGKHDAPAALAALDGYLARFPGGVLSQEARVARVDALLMLDRADEAARALEALPLDAHRRSTELQVIRGELRARTDCRSAEADFTAVLQRVNTPALEERALYGRAACRSQMGNAGGAAEDLRRYLERFPNGDHSGWARRWLDNNR